MKRVNKRPVDHFEGKWEKGKKYTLYAIVKNNGTLFRSLTPKEKAEPYVIYDSTNETFSANAGWEIVELSEDSRMSAGGNISKQDVETALEPYAKSADLSTVATSGSYSDLSNIPTDLVKTSAQTFTEAQKSQARTNLGAASAEEVEALADQKYEGPYDDGELPSASADTMGAIYLVGPDTNDEYERFVTRLSGSTYSWVSLGMTSVNLANYTTKAEVSQLEAKVDGDIIGPKEGVSPSTTHAYISSNGTYVSANNEWALTEPIPIKNGNILSATFSGASNTAQFARLNEDNTYTPLITTATGYGEHSYTATEDCNVVISAYVYSKPLTDVYVVRKDLGLQDRMVKVESVIDGGETDNISAQLSDGYISYGAAFYINSVFKISAPIQMFAGDILSCKSMLGENVGVVSLCKEDGTPIEVVVRGADNDNALTYTYTAEKDCFVRIGGKLAYPPRDIVIVRNGAINVNKINIDAIVPTSPEVDDLLVKMLIIGDSLTEGAEITSDNQARVLTENYPHYLAKLSRIDIHKEAESGWSASNFWNGGTRHAPDNTTYSWGGFNDNAGYDFTEYDSFVIWLGTNQGLTDTLDTDVIPFNDYNDFAETQTGYYCKIIAKIISQVPNARIFLCSIFDSLTSVETTNLVLGKISELYGNNIVGIINNGVGTICYNEWASFNKLFHNFNRNQVHYNKVGYFFVAKHILDEIRRLIGARLDMFKVPVLPAYNRGSV